MNRHEARQIERQLKERYPGSEIIVDREPGGLRIEVRSGRGFSIFAVTAGEPSAVLAALMEPSYPDK
jgi:hypothetical protein